MRDLFERVNLLREQLEREMQDAGEWDAGDGDLYEDLPCAGGAAAPPVDPDSSFLNRRSIPSEIESQAPPGTPHPELDATGDDKCDIPQNMDEQQKLELAQLLLQIQEMELTFLPQSFFYRCLKVSFPAASYPTFPGPRRPRRRPLEKLSLFAQVQFASMLFCSFSCLGEFGP